MVLTGFLASLCAGAATGLGAIPLFFVRKISDKLQDSFLGFAAGVMLSASFFSLIIPALELGSEMYGSEHASVIIVIVAFFFGAGLVWIINEIVPHEHFVLGKEGGSASNLRKIWLFIIAITIHNFPEGMAVGVGFGGGDVARGTSLALGIGLQNMPEGLAVAVALLSQNYSKKRAIWIALLTGLVEPIGGLIGIAAVSISEPVLPWGLGFAAGAMIFIISHEIIPETHRRGHQDAATLGLLIGFATMMYLDVTFG